MALHARHHLPDRDGAAEFVAEEVTPAPTIPHGMMTWPQARSASQLRAKPCMVTCFATRMPMAPTLRLGPRSSASTHAPLWPGTRAAATPKSAQVRIMASSRRRTCATTSIGGASRTIG